MDTPVRLRLYQYTYSPFCIPIELLLRHSGIQFDLVNLHVGDPTPVIQLTKGEYYQVPVLQDLFTHDVVYDKSPDGMDVPRYIDNLAPLLRLFPVEAEGIQRILLHYIENECESRSFKVCDANWDKWIKNDVERGLLRRHKERKFGVGCLDEWRRDIKELTAAFHHCIQPFEMLLNKSPFLTGERPVFADYALCGVIGNFLFPGNTSLPENCLMLEAWYTKMRAGNFRSDLDPMQLASAGQFDAQAGSYGKSHILADVADVEKVLGELKLRPNTDALDVATGNGHTAIALAKKGFRVIANDVSNRMLEQAMKLAVDEGVNIDFREHTAEKLPYPDNAFGLVTCRVASHHFSSPEQFFREATRVLKMYGYVVIIDTTVPDDHVEAAQWMDQLERLRDPSHVKYVTPNTWKKYAADNGITVTKVEIQPFKQPDLNWYFNVANTPPENRKKVLEMIAKAPASVRELFKLAQEDGKIVWYWRRLTFVAGKI
ncbi:MAG TPA: methyltransferase domain-containing protein [Candidatus Methylacidiphilales bacterium]|jgi:SAM-dependent methyltransferase|nr:methyltransferase domain-containing protein [Candidatus Methylacidiphilales bacterium]